jgi:hypothetical protein
MAVIFLDLDGFKAINDQLGHTIGHAVLIEIAERLRSAVRQDDTIARATVATNSWSSAPKPIPTPRSTSPSGSRRLFADHW